mmetsp:Transcript_64283/g.158181  ORF Transcript_64283/g.158181 Transcript_64283/m.158181 type:complete len:251 (+) Transcript_64283:2748-3500(+)
MVVARDGRIFFGPESPARDRAFLWLKLLTLGSFPGTVCMDHDKRRPLRHGDGVPQGMLHGIPHSGLGSCHHHIVLPPHDIRIIPHHRLHAHHGQDMAGPSHGLVAHFNSHVRLRQHLLHRALEHLGVALIEEVVVPRSHAAAQDTENEAPARGKGLEHRVLDVLHRHVWAHGLLEGLGREVPVLLDLPSLVLRRHDEGLQALLDGLDALLGAILLLLLDLLGGLPRRLRVRDCGRPGGSRQGLRRWLGQR